MRGGTPLHAGAARPALPLAGSENTQDEGFPFHSPTSVLPDGHLAATCHHLHHQAPKSVQRIRKWLKPAPAFLTVPSVAPRPPNKSSQGAQKADAGEHGLENRGRAAHRVCVLPAPVWRAVLPGSLLDPAHVGLSSPGRHVLCTHLNVN